MIPLPGRSDHVITLALDIACSGQLMHKNPKRISIASKWPIVYYRPYDVSDSMWIPSTFYWSHRYPKAVGLRYQKPLMYISYQNPLPFETAAAKVDHCNGSVPSPVFVHPLRHRHCNFSIFFVLRTLQAKKNRKFYSYSFPLVRMSTKESRDKGQCEEMKLLARPLDASPEQLYPKHLERINGFRI